MHRRNISELGTVRNRHSDKPFYLYAGNQNCQVRNLNLKRINMVAVTKKVAAKLKVPATVYQIYHDENQSFYLGPIIGVLSSAIKPGGLPGRSESRFHKEMIRFARKRGILVYMFGPSGVDKKRNLIRGITTDKDDKWVKGLFPRPNIVYNRIRQRKIENTPEVSRILEQFSQDENLVMFNSRYLNKWEVYQAIHGIPIVAGLLPLTMALNPSNLETMLTNFGQVIIKPVGGSLGKGIVKIEVRDKHYELIESSAPTRRQRYHSIEELSMAIINRIGVKRACLLQRLVEMSKFKGRIFDIRAQFQKDLHGTWVITGAAVRVAARNQFVTHIPNGGRAEAYHTVIHHVFPLQSTRNGLKKQMDYICNHVPALLEERLGLNLAILSMDIAIDPEGKMWILEVNSKPSHFDETDIRHRHLKLLTEYSVYAAVELRRKLIERRGL